MVVTAKFRCTAKTERENWGGPGFCNYGITLQAATGPGNEAWSKATPTGTIELTVTNPTAVAEYVVGQEYLLTFEAATAQKISEQNPEGVAA